MTHPTGTSPSTAAARASASAACMNEVSLSKAESEYFIPIFPEPGPSFGSGNRWQKVFDKGDIPQAAAMPRVLFVKANNAPPRRLT